jgi:hypothetical protein
VSARPLPTRPLFLVLGLLAAGRVPCLAAELSVALPGWARLVVTVTEGEPSETRRFELPVRLDGSTASLHDGGTVALPNATFDATAAGGTQPVTSYTYQNVGFQLSVRVTPGEDGSLDLVGQAQSSRLATGQADGAPPTLQRVEQTFAVRVKRGSSTHVIDQRRGLAGPLVVAIAVEP